MLTLSALTDFPMVESGDDIAELIFDSLNHNAISLENNDILVIAQKIISKSEGRHFDLGTIKPSDKAYELADFSEKDPRLIELILSESNRVVRIRKGTIIVEHRLGFICANAGIDHSNVSDNNSSGEIVLLLPEYPDRSAAIIRKSLESLTQKRIGVLIIDSHGRAWRLGIVGSTIGLSGLPGLVDMRGKPDLFGSNLKITQIGAADELAAAASLIMGQASEGLPVVHVRGFPYKLREGNLEEIIRPIEFDLFR